MMLLTGSGHVDAQRAFTRATRARTRAALARRLRRGGGCERLPVLAAAHPARGAGALARGVAQIPLAAIRGTTEPSKAAVFDDRFRPAASARPRWERIWLAEHRGVPLPPISVVPARGGFAVRDGHHRVSVALARGAVAIDAIVDAADQGTVSGPLSM
jgi:hypothetical protein